ncbi:MAG: hypothetical protein AAF547_10830 [Actinomycetota bacterium]
MPTPSLSGRRRLLVFGALAIALVAGCGDDDSGDSEISAEEPDGPTTSEDEPNTTTATEAPSTTTTTSDTATTGQDDTTTTATAVETTTATTASDTVTTTADSTTTTGLDTTTTTESTPVELPSQDITVSVTGRTVEQILDKSTTRSIECGSSCTIEIFTAQPGEYQASWSSNPGGGVVAVVEADACFSGGTLFPSGTGVGAVCEVVLEAEATTQYRATTATVRFKAAPAVEFTWSADPAGGELAIGDVVTLRVQMSREGAAAGNLVIWGWNTDLPFTVIEPGTAEFAVAPLGCDEPIVVEFGLDMSGVVFGQGNGPTELRWNVACEPTTGSQPATTVAGP